MKLELNQNTLDDRIIAVQRQVDLGVLPRADERIRRLESRLSTLISDIDNRWDQHDRDYPPQWLVNEVVQIERDLEEFKKWHADNFTPARNLQPRD